MQTSPLKKIFFLFLISLCSLSFSQLPIDSQGWTILTPSSDSRVIFVSSSSGSDSNTGLYFLSPKKTIAAGLALLRDGFPDYLLLKRGDVWYESFGVFNKGGRGAAEPIVISSYDPTGSPCSARPLIKSGNDDGFKTQGGISSKKDNIVLLGIHFYANKRDPKSPEYDPSVPSTVGLSIRKPSENILVEDCVVEFYKDNVQVISVPANGAIKNFKMRRSVCADAYSSTSTSAHAQGVYIDKVHGVLFEENIFDHNGWHDTIGGAAATIFNHNFYIQYSDSSMHCKDVIIRGNIIARASSHGLQLRPGGIADNNLFLQNGLAMFNGRYFPSTTTNNVVLDGKNIAASSRGMGIEIKRNAHAIIANNIVAHKTNVNVGDRYAYEIRYNPYEYEVPVSHIEFKNNIAYNWRGPCLDVNSMPVSGDTYIVEQNEFHNFHNNYLVNNMGATIPPGFQYSKNTYYDNAAVNKWFRVGSTNYDTAGWKNLSGEAGPKFQQINYIDPNRDIASYQSTLGGVASLEEFLLEARKQSKCNWRKEYTAVGVNNYIRKGFCKTNQLPTATFSYKMSGYTVHFSNKSIDADSSYWYFGDGSTSNSKNPEHKYASAGVYTVTLVSVNKCGTQSKVLIVSVTPSINKNRVALSRDVVKIYPNPAKDDLTIDIDNTLGYDENEKVEIKIVNILGQEVKTVSSFIGNANSQSVDIRDCVPGIYNTIVSIGEDCFFKTIIIE